MRVVRLTSSKFYDICHSKIDKTVKANNIYDENFKDLSNIPAIKYGIEHEGMVKNVISKKYKNYIFRNTGIVVNPFFPYLGASPDGLLHNPSDTFIVEIKCVFNPQNLDLISLVQSRQQFCLTYNDEKFSLRINHPYMYQIQGQLALTNLKKCLFVLLYRSNYPVYTEEICFNPVMWNTMKKKLKDFFFIFIYQLS